MKVHTLGWLGNVVRKATGRQTRRMEDKGRPRQTWMDDAKSDPRNTGVKRWGTQALDRTEWAPVVEEAKTKLKEP
jgi:hypothetical protein